ncbi:hypothetical protein KMW28_17485 [Flammeovirga yaeyamensis]|uniref:Uncharacterized protein n=1 Tax=Flammeovirga yaeyamensis TaxID=367791 RepID=A0AAX1N1Y4_9BACT|nr:hypothetical protein [Flammeovirga yaeyamensis]MBB3698187.1 hypothetical protein [Flammeovirga yaeyamensis]NMF34458.1 hypothetical protein [Flammeovirga yaeyamensis]QWG01437.1 hypothetical protein KMW28_17485 [Flammeovirga yaeyamensis]
MQTEILELVLASVDVEQKYFSYKKEEYVRHLLEMVISKNLHSKSLIKNSSFDFLLNKPAFHRLTAKSGKAQYSKDQFIYSDDLKHFKITLGRWGEFENHRNDDWYQTSLPGENLVIQLNFDLDHELIYRKFFDIDDWHPFTMSCHPISEKYSTMAWSRLDFNLDTGEAFIEEIQNDWLRDALDTHRKIKSIPEKRQKNH